MVVLSLICIVSCLQTTSTTLVHLQFHCLQVSVKLATKINNQSSFVHVFVQCHYQLCYQHPLQHHHLVSEVNQSSNVSILFKVCIFEIKNVVPPCVRCTRLVLCYSKHTLSISSSVLMCSGECLCSVIIKCVSNTHSNTITWWVKWCSHICLSMLADTASVPIGL